MSILGPMQDSKHNKIFGAPIHHLEIKISGVC